MRVTRCGGANSSQVKLQLARDNTGQRRTEDEARGKAMAAPLAGAIGTGSPTEPSAQQVNL